MALKITKAADPIIVERLNLVIYAQLRQGRAPRGKPQGHIVRVSWALSAEDPNDTPPFAA